MLIFDKIVIAMWQDELKGIYKLSEEELKAINEGIGQLDNGFYLTQEEANAKIEDVLNNNVRLNSK